MRAINASSAPVERTCLREITPSWRARRSEMPTPTPWPCWREPRILPAGSCGQPSNLDLMSRRSGNLSVAALLVCAVAAGVTVGPAVADPGPSRPEPDKRQAQRGPHNLGRRTRQARAVRAPRAAHAPRDHQRHHLAGRARHHVPPVGPDRHARPDPRLPVDHRPRDPRPGHRLRVAQVGAQHRDRAPHDQRRTARSPGSTATSTTSSTPEPRSAWASTASAGSLHARKSGWNRAFLIKDGVPAIANLPMKAQGRPGALDEDHALQLAHDLRRPDRRLRLPLG